ncbi:DUF4123 domain-containing protein [Aeromonas veronii]|uniref:DUF4123 domain-containing protein n=1 Tax=Aeromonas veronii TaxID=654 RepID=UPI0023634AD0|nr:DUF4123 domain-containing protein [Aeromonas veronii]MDD1847235.1 DUF4123 domain-containing protein [Aeromonas veronii]
MDLPEFTLAPHEHLYLLLDGGQLPALEQQLFEVTGNPVYQQLYFCAPWEGMREVSPCLVEANDELLRWYGVQPVNAGWVLASSLTLAPLAEHLRQFIEVESPYGSRILLKLASPQTMACLMVDMSPLLWQSLSQAWLPSNHNWLHLQVKPNLADPVSTQLRLSDEQWSRLGEVSWQHQLTINMAHVAQWFPARASSLPELQSWVAHWSAQAYQLGFQTECDQLSFFNVLGCLGDAWWGTDDFPTLTELLTTPSARTPSQRIEAAAHWAAQRAHPELM